MIDLDDSRQAGAEIVVTPQMVEAGVEAYRHNASHDEKSFLSPEELVLAVLRAGIAAGS